MWIIMFAVVMNFAAVDYDDEINTEINTNLVLWTFPFSSRVQ